MLLNHSLRTQCLQIGSKAQNKTEILKEIARLAHKSPLLSRYSEDDIFQALEARERIGSTGFERGIAIPHCSLENIEEFVVGVLLIPQGVDFDSQDRQKTRIFCFIIGPKIKRNQHIQILSTVSKLLKSPQVVERLLEAQTGDDIVNQLLKLDKFEEVKGKKEKCLFQVFVQREGYFDDILQIFSSVVQGSISVIETNNAGYYLHRLPLFSSFWTEQTKTFSRIILAVVDKELSNDVIRRINMIVDDIEKEWGVLITVQDLSYTSGSIEF